MYLRAIIACCIGSAQSIAEAGEVRLGSLSANRTMIVVLEGTITKGDFFKFSDALERATKIGARGVVLVLNSPGGLHFEALQIAMLAKRKGVATRIEAGAICVSACSSIFFAGYDGKAGKSNRSADASSRIGLHMFRPAPGHVPTPERVDRAVRGAQWYLDEMRIPKSVQRRFFETPPDQVYFLTLAEMIESDVRITYSAPGAADDAARKVGNQAAAAPDPSGGPPYTPLPSRLPVVPPRTREACADDVRTFCSGVRSGPDNPVAACMERHAALLSDRCKAAIIQTQQER